MSSASSVALSGQAAYGWLVRNKDDRLVEWWIVPMMMIVAGIVFIVLAFVG